MATDIKLADDQVLVEGNTTMTGALTVGSDLNVAGTITVGDSLEVKGLFGARVRVLEGWKWLNYPERIMCLAQDLVLSYKPVDDHAATSYALSHMSDDTLVINRGSGYEGGVSIEGNVALPGQVKAGQLIIADSTIRLHTTSSDDFSIREPGVPSRPNTRPVDVDLVQVIKTLCSEVETLKAKLAAVENHV